MSQQVNTFKAAILAGRPQIGIWSSMCSHVGAEIIADAGFDWILIDTEHSPVDISGVYPLLQAVGRGTAAPIVRVAWNDPVLLKRVLDIGAQTVLVPFVQNAQEAATAVQGCLYPPHGMRGVSGSMRANRYGRDVSYGTTAADELCLIVQVETEEALANIAEIALVPGVDGVFVGPSDLAASMGHLGNPNHPDVQTAIRGAIDTLKGLNVPGGILTPSAVDAARYQEWGYCFVAGGVDTAMLAKAADTLATQLRASAEEVSK